MIVPPDGWTVAALPSEGPATVPGVKEHLSIVDDADDVLLGAYVKAVNSLLRGWPVVYGVTDDPGWPDHIVTGATLLVARLWSRRNSANGVASFGDQGAVYVQRNDPDVAMLLRLGNYAPPAVG